MKFTVQMYDRVQLLTPFLTTCPLQGDIFRTRACARPVDPRIGGGMVIFRRSLRAQVPIPCYNTPVWGVQRAQDHSHTPRWTRDTISDDLDFFSRSRPVELEEFLDGTTDFKSQYFMPTMSQTAQSS